MNKRLISYLGLLAYMMTNRAVQENNLEAAEKGAAIYRLVEPLNPEHAYLSAMIKMKRDDPEGALKFLEQAVMLGFTDRERIFNEPAFAPISNREEFINLL
ncbi:MAG: TPR end-of-group domain-containing protein [Bacteroidales bacterium]